MMSMHLLNKNVNVNSVVFFGSKNSFIFAVSLVFRSQKRTNGGAVFFYSVLLLHYCDVDLIKTTVSVVLVNCRT